jgi:hypothetical protein
MYLNNSQQLTTTPPTFQERSLDHYNITPVRCWAHARRKYNDVLKAESKSKGWAHKAISFISQLYKLETQAKNKNLSSEERFQLIQEKHCQF